MKTFRKLHLKAMSKKLKVIENLKIKGSTKKLKMMVGMCSLKLTLRIFKKTQAVKGSTLSFWSLRTKKDKNHQPIHKICRMIRNYPQRGSKRKQSFWLRIFKKKKNN